MNKHLFAFITCILSLLHYAPVNAQGTLMPLPPHTTTYNFSSHIRGYWFTAPANFNITGLRVPVEAGVGVQTIYVVIINDAVPVVWPTVSTNITQLYSITGAPNMVIQNVNIPIAAGQRVGIFGYAGGVHSYGTANFVSNINGMPVTLVRAGTQNLFTPGAAFPDYWTEPPSPIARIEMYYGCGAVDSNYVTICDNTSYSIGTNTYNQSGHYIDTLDQGGCDSIVHTFLTVNPTYNINFVDSFYEGTSYTFNDNVYYYEGNYSSRFTTVNGCDSFVSLKLLEIPVRKYDIDTTICSYQDFVFFGRVYENSGRYIDTLIFSDHHKILNLRLIKKRPMELSVSVDKELDKLCIGQPIVLTGFGAANYIWYIKDDPLYEKLYTGNPYNAAVFNDYNHMVMEGIDADGCVESHPFSLVGHDCCQYFVPNAFSPNGDGLNDVFEVKGVQPKIYRLEIFTRWGAKVFSSENIDRGWNGANSSGDVLPPDVYYYYLTGQCYDGTNIDRRGDITLIR